MPDPTSNPAWSLALEKAYVLSVAEKPASCTPGLILHHMTSNLDDVARRMMYRRSHHFDKAMLESLVRITAGCRLLAESLDLMYWLPSRGEEIDGK